MEQQELTVSKYLVESLRRYKGLVAIFMLSSFFLIALEGVSIGLLIPLFKLIFEGGTRHFDFRFAGREFSFGVSAVMTMIFGAIVIKDVFDFISRVHTVKIKTLITADLRRRLFDRLMEMKIEYFNDESMGKINNAVIGEAARAGLAAYSILKIILYAAITIFYVAWLFVINVKLTAVFFVFFILMYIGSFLLLKVSKKTGSQLTQFRNRLSSFINDAFYGVRVIMLFVRGNVEKERFNRLVEENYRAEYVSGKLLEIVQPITQIIVTGGMIILILAFMHTFKEEFRSQLPYLAAYLFIVFRIIPNIAVINTSKSQFLIQRNGFLSVFNILNYEVQNRFIDGTLDCPGLSQEIRFEGVSFSYSRESAFRMEGVSFAIPKNKITAIVGQSGSGKSTLIELLCRFYDPHEGRVTCDGRDLREYKAATWRQLLGVVSQEVILFNDTVRNNIRYSRQDASDAELDQAVRFAHCTEFIAELPQGLDTVIGERGGKLSGGQKQRISIARAFLKNPEILILDEATSSLDSETERFIKEAIEQLMKGKTVVIITHRLHTIEKADQIITIRDGKVVSADGQETPRYAAAPVSCH